MLRIGILSLLLASPAAAVEVVLRDTIGCDANGENCDSAATDDVSAAFANTNSGTLYSSPGLRFSNTSSRRARVKRISVVIYALENGLPLNDPGEIYSLFDLRAHFWSGGVEGNSESFDANPALGNEVVLLDATNSTLAELGFVTGRAGTYTTFVLSSELDGVTVAVSPGQEMVYSVLEQLTTLQNDFPLIAWSTTFFGVQDVYQSESTLPEDRPGFLNAQLGLPVGSYAGFVSAEFLEGDYNGDGVVDAADYPVWRDNLGTTGLDAWAPGDGNGDGDITLADYDVWRSQYGMTLADLATPSAAGPTGVPEPASVVLLVGLLALGRRRR